MMLFTLVETRLYSTTIYKLDHSIYNTFSFQSWSAEVLTVDL